MRWQGVEVVGEYPPIPPLSRDPERSVDAPTGDQHLRLLRPEVDLTENVRHWNSRLQERQRRLQEIRDRLGLQPGDSLLGVLSLLSEMCSDPLDALTNP